MGYFQTNNLSAGSGFPFDTIHVLPDQLDDLSDAPIFNFDCKSYPFTAAPSSAREIAQRGWNLLADDFCYPLAVLNRKAMDGNHLWMQQLATRMGASLAPEGGSTMSPELFRLQLDYGAWGLSFSSVHQAKLGVQAGATHIIITNQVLSDGELDTLCSLLISHRHLRICFLINAMAQVAILQDWGLRRKSNVCFDILLEIGLPGQNMGCRTQTQAMVLARALRYCPITRLNGFECHLPNTIGAEDAFALAGMVHELSACCESEHLYQGEEILISTNEPSLLEALNRTQRHPAEANKIRPVLHTQYCSAALPLELGKNQGHAISPSHAQPQTGLQTSLELWALVHSVPEYGTALLNCSEADFPREQSHPQSVRWARRGQKFACTAPPDWEVIAFDEPYLHLHYDASSSAPRVGDRVALRLPTACVSFDRWHWLPLVEEDWSVSSAISTRF